MHGCSVISFPGIRTVAAIIVAVALAASNWKAYTMGEKNVQADWDAAKVETLKLARQRDNALKISKEKALEEQKKNLVANSLAADRARVASERLRDSSERSLTAARETHAACVVSASTHAKLLDYCEREYRGMAKTADGHTSDIKAMIQAWPR